VASNAHDEFVRLYKMLMDISYTVIDLLQIYQVINIIGTSGNLSLEKALQLHTPLSTNTSKNTFKSTLFLY